MLILSGNKFFNFESEGEFHSNGEWIHPERIINSYELLFVLEGEVCIFEENDEYVLKKNDFLILRPNKKHGGTKKTSAPTSFFWLHFTTNFDFPCRIFKEAEYYDVKYLLKKLLHMSKTPVYEKNALDATAYMIYCELNAALQNSKKNSLACKIAEYIRINAQKGIYVKDVAEHYGYCIDHIGRLFKSCFGTGIRNYISLERMKIAKDFLMNTNLSVKEISAEMGFDEEKLFIKFFTYHDGISPAKFRNKYFNTHMNNK